MSRNKFSKEIIKILSINFSILLVFIFSPALLYKIYWGFKSRIRLLITPPIPEDYPVSAHYPTYADKNFSVQLFKEYDKIPYFYRSYIGWRMEKANFEYINISGPYNTRKSTGEALDNSIWFFGGSTMWGTGASDSQTIPSHFNSLTNNKVYNFGEGSWNSRQSLNQLISAIGDKNNPSAVVFYDGVNDVLNLCRSEVKLLPAHSMEKRIQYAVYPKTVPVVPLLKRVSKFIIAPYIALAKKFSVQIPVVSKSNSNGFDCDTNQEKARSIAHHLVNNWRTAYLLSKSNDFEFYAILQPTLFTTKTNSEYFLSNHVNENLLFINQYNTVYPLIVKEMQTYCLSDSNFCSSMINGTNWLDGTNNIFIDFCHVNSLGNKIIAEQIKSLL